MHMKLSPSLFGLAGITAVTLGLNLVTIIPRLLSGKRPSSWPRDKPEAHPGPEVGLRARNAHANAVENLVVYAALVYVAIASGNPGVTDRWMKWCLLFRIAQAAAATATEQTDNVVRVRALMWFPQLLMQLKMAWDLVVPDLIE